MKGCNLLLLGLLTAACSTENSKASDVPAASGWGDDHLARRVSGVCQLRRISGLPTRKSINPAAIEVAHPPI